MSGLQVIEHKGNLVMDSRIVAKMVEREHKEVLRDIRNIIGHLGESKNALTYFIESTYKNSQNKTLPHFLLTKKGCELFSTRMTGAKGTQFAVAYIDRFNEMEEKLKAQKHLLPTSYKEALLALVEEVEKNEQLEAQKLLLETELKEAEPKVSYYDSILRSKDLLTITQIASDYGMTAQALNKKLKDMKIQYKQSGQWLLYAKYKDEGYVFSHTNLFTHSDGREGSNQTTKWSQKGRLFLYEELKKEGILPTIEKEYVEILN